MATVVRVEGRAVVESRGHILLIVSDHAAVTARCGTVDVRGDATVIAVGPVQVFARDRAVISCRRDAVGAPVVRCHPTVTVRGDFDTLLPLK